MKRNVYLVQVNHQFGDNVFLPYSVGLLQAYCQTIDRINENYLFRDFTYLRGDPKAISRNMDNPSVVGVSCYLWNWEWNKALARSIRESHPDCLIVFGGPQVPVNSENFYQEHPYVDLIVHYEGEIGFSEILLEGLEQDPDYTRVSGLSIRARDNRCHRTPSRDRQVELGQLPSPYLSGAFDHLIDEPYSFHASQESHRGCPYSCTFCDWGSAVFTKVRAFTDERLEQELEWFGAHQIEMLYSCDANYGLLKRDLDLTQRMVQTKQKFGFPKQFRAAYAKNSSDKIFDIAKALNDGGMNKGVTLSFQSMDPSTLDVIRRSNIKIDDFAQLVKRYRSENIATYTELIMGLPGETYDSFLDGIEQILVAGQHNGLNIYLCNVLPNSEMGDPAYKELHGIKSARMPLLLQHCSPAVDGIGEYNDIVVETNVLPLEQWKKVFLYGWSIQAFHCLPLTQFLAIYLHYESGIAYRDFYEALLKFAESRPDTALGREFQLVSQAVDGALDGGEWGVVIDEFGDIIWPNEEATFLNLVCDKDKFYAEADDFIRQFLWAKGLDMDEQLLNDLMQYQKSIVSDPYAPESFEVTLSYDFQEFFNRAFLNDSAPLTKRSSRLLITPDLTFGGDLESYARQTVWYGRKGGHFTHTKVEETGKADLAAPVP